MNRERYAINDQETYFLSVYREENEEFDYYSIDLENESYLISSEQMDRLHKYIHSMFNEYTMLRDFRAYFNELNHDDFLEDLKRLKIDIQVK